MCTDARVAHNFDMNDQSLGQPPTTKQETRVALLKRNLRTFILINNLFVQEPRGSKSRHRFLKLPYSYWTDDRYGTCPQPPCCRFR